MAEHGAGAVDDGEPQTFARDARGIVEAAEFLKDCALIGGRDARAGVMDGDAYFLANLLGADAHGALARIADGVGQEILQDPAQQAKIGVHPKVTLGHVEHQSFGTGQRRELNA